MRSSLTSRKAAFVLLLAALGACGGTPPTREQREEGEREIELKPAVPAFPDLQQLIRIDLGPLQRLDYWIDPASITMADLQSVLYTLVVRSPQGATNITYEAMRCSPLQRRIFAVGRSDGTWSPSGREEWIPIPRSDTAYFSIASDYVCPRRQRVGSADELVRAVRMGGHPDAR